MPGNELERKGKHLKPNYSFDIAYVLYLLDNSIVYGVYFPMIFQSLFLNKKKNLAVPHGMWDLSSSTRD